MNIEIYNSFSSDLEVRWRNFEKCSDLTVFQTFDWINSWRKSFSNNKIKYQIVFISENGEDILLFPLNIKKVYGVRVLEWIGNFYSDYHCPLIKKNTILTKNTFLNIWSDVKKKLEFFDTIHFIKQKDLIENSRNPFTEFLSKSLYQDVFNINISDNYWPDYYKEKNNSKTRETDRRKNRKLNYGYETVFEIIVNKDAKEKMIENLISNKSFFYEKKKIYTNLASFNAKKFYKMINSLNSEHLITHLSILKKKNEILASNFGVCFENTFYYLIPYSYTGSLTKYSPGRYLLTKLIEWAFDNKFKKFDFTGGDEDYKKSWSNNHEYLYYYLNFSTIRGFIYCLIYKLINLAKKSKLLKKIYYKIIQL